MDVKLDNCRFCGSDDLDVNTFTNTGTETKDVLVYCKNCKSVADASTWNKHPFEDELRAENERLRSALAWYADEKNYLRGASGENTFPSESLSPMWLCDVGERARKALKGGG